MLSQQLHSCGTRRCSFTSTAYSAPRSRLELHQTRKSYTYQAVALACGKPRAARSVGQTMARNPFSFIADRASNQKVPCHRVVHADGSLGGYSGKERLIAEKIRLLKREGVNVKNGKVVDFLEVFFDFYE